MTTKRPRSQWLDISVPIRTGMVHWPGDPDVNVRWMLRLEKGAECNMSTLSFGVHTGTHMDAPLHFLPGGNTIDQMPLDATIGPAKVILIKDPKAIGPQELKRHPIERGDRILFKTRNSKVSSNTSTFDPEFVYITKEAAQFLADSQVQTVGIDYLSVGGFKHDSVETHQTLLRAGIWIIEGLDLSKVKPGRYELVCLPLRILGAEGAPARAILRPL